MNKEDKKMLGCTFDAIDKTFKCLETYMQCMTKTNLNSDNSCDASYAICKNKAIMYLNTCPYKD